jgi:hypothetical protein
MDGNHAGSPPGRCSPDTCRCPGRSSVSRRASPGRKPNRSKPRSDPGSPTTDRTTLRGEVPAPNFRWFCPAGAALLGGGSHCDPARLADGIEQKVAYTKMPRRDKGRNSADGRRPQCRGTVCTTGGRHLACVSATQCGAGRAGDEQDRQIGPRGRLCSPRGIDPLPCLGLSAGGVFISR